MNEKDEFINYFRELQPNFSRLCAHILERQKLTMPQFALLSQLVQARTMVMTAASARMHISKPAVTSLVDRLEKKKCLRRINDVNDRRVSILKILPRGEKMVREMQEKMLVFFLQTLDQLTPKERKTIIRFYRILTQTVYEALCLRKK